MVFQADSRRAGLCSSVIGSVTISFFVPSCPPVRSVGLVVGLLLSLNGGKLYVHTPIVSLVSSKHRPSFLFVIVKASSNILK